MTCKRPARSQGHPAWHMANMAAFFELVFAEIGALRAEDGLLLSALEDGADGRIHGAAARKSRMEPF